jgi:glutamine synthetase
MVEALGADFARIHVALLRHVWRRFLSHVTDWEIQEYRDLL